MPGNIVVINYSKDLEWYVGDSKMELLLALLDEIGFREKGMGLKKPGKILIKIASCRTCADGHKGWN